MVGSGGGGYIEGMIVCQFENVQICPSAWLCRRTRRADLYQRRVTDTRRGSFHGGWSSLSNWVVDQCAGLGVKGYRWRF